MSPAKTDEERQEAVKSNEEWPRKAKAATRIAKDLLRCGGTEAKQQTVAAGRCQVISGI